MKVQLNVARATQLAAQEAGETIDVDDEEGRRLIASGQGERVDPVESPEAKAEGARRPSRRTKHEEREP